MRHLDEIAIGIEQQKLALAAQPVAPVPPFLEGRHEVGKPRRFDALGHRIDIVHKDLDHHAAPQRLLKGPGLPAPVALKEHHLGAVRKVGHDPGLRADLRAKYAEDTFYRRDAFRPDFAAYADQTVCTAQAMIDVSAPDTRFREYESTLDAALQALIEHTRAGREAVRARNVSDYRKWFDGADARIVAVREAALAVR